MASTLSRKRPRSTTRQHEPRVPRVSTLTVDQFRAMLEDIIDARLAEWTDPDAGLELRPEVVERIQRQRADYAAGIRGKSLDEIAQKYDAKL